MTDTTRRRRHGPEPLDPAIKRDHCVSVRLNREELAWLDSARQSVKMQRGQYLRSAAMGRLPRSIPELNQVAWVELSRAASNLNQISKAINSAGFDADSIPAIQSALNDFRKRLIGVTA